LVSASMEGHTWDFVVIGAGVAGITVAHQLHQQGKSVVVLEARDRIGGRVHTETVLVNDKPLIIEHGAQFLHGAQSNTVLKFLKHEKIKINTLPGPDWEDENILDLLHNGKHLETKEKEEYEVDKLIVLISCANAVVGTLSCSTRVPLGHQTKLHAISRRGRPEFG